MVRSEIHRRAKDMGNHSLSWGFSPQKSEGTGIQTLHAVLQTAGLPPALGIAQVSTAHTLLVLFRVIFHLFPGISSLNITGTLAEGSTHNWNNLNPQGNQETVFAQHTPAQMITTKEPT